MTGRNQFLYDIWRSCSSQRQKEFITYFLDALGELNEEDITNNRLPDVTIELNSGFFWEYENPIKIIQEQYGAHITVSNETESDTSTDISVFEREEIRFDSKSKTWKIRLWSSPLFDELYFQHVPVSEMQSFGIAFWNIWDMKSQYGVFLYFYLIQQLPHIPDDQNGISWTVPVDILKRILHCDTQEHYKAYKYFHNDVLKKAADDIDNRSGLKFKYEQIKEVRTVVDIKFTLYKRKKD